MRLVFCLVALVTLGFGHFAVALTIGQIKDVQGTVTVQRTTGDEVATAGFALEVQDVIVTGEDGSVGMTFSDNSTLSLGPDTILSITKYFFERSGREDEFEARIEQGTLVATSGEIAKKREGAMTFVTPTTVLGVRGTTFVLRVAPQEAETATATASGN